MSRYRNSRTEGFIQSVPEKSVATEGEQLSERCKFNFHYFRPDPPGQGWGDWGHGDLVKLFGKLQAFSEKSLSYWENQHAGREGRILSIYDCFPLKSDFSHPKSVPHDVRWARFRLEQRVRLIGFVIPSALNGTPDRAKHAFCSNTFYVVFLDRDHRFYLTGK